MALDPVQMYLCIKFEGSTIKHTASQIGTGKKKNVCHLKDVDHIDYVDMCARYEVSMIKTVARKTVHRQW